MTRISENQSTRVLVGNTLDNKRKLNEFADEITTGYKVTLPGDSNQAGTVSQYRQTIDKIDSYSTTIVQAKSFMQFQDDAMSQVSDIIIRAKEIAQQAANETNSSTARAQLASEIFQIRDHLTSLANSTFQGKYVWGGAADDTPPYIASTYNRKEGRALGEVTKFLVYNARKRQDGGDRADTYFQRTECVAGVQDMRFQELMPDVLHWMGVKKIDRLVSMSDMKYNAITRSGIEVGERVSIPEDAIPKDARVEMDAKKAAGYFSDTGAPTAADLAKKTGRDLEE